jgi:hypothetical protein
VLEAIDMNRILVALVGLLLWVPSTALAGGQGQVTSVLTRQSERLFAVRVISIDGHNMPSARSLVRLQPGKRRLGVIALIERDNAFNLRNRDRPQPQYVDIDVEAGKHYRIGAKVSDARYQEWTAVFEFR